MTALLLKCYISGGFGAYWIWIKRTKMLACLVQGVIGLTRDRLLHLFCLLLMDICLPLSQLRQQQQSKKPIIDLLPPNGIWFDRQKKNQKRRRLFIFVAWIPFMAVSRAANVAFLCPVLIEADVMCVLQHCMHSLWSICATCWRKSILVACLSYEILIWFFVSKWDAVVICFLNNF